AARGSISLTERRTAGRERTDVPRLCEALVATGSPFCRVASRPRRLRLADRLAGRHVDRPIRPVTIRGLTCVRLNAPCGFGPGTLDLVERAAGTGGIVVVYGHPHSLQSGGVQAEASLVPFLQRLGELQRAGRLRTALPRELLAVG